MDPVPPPPPPRQASSGLGTGAKVAIGCAAGCGVLILLAGAGLLVGVYRLVSPGEQVATLDLVGPESAGVVHLRDGGGEAGLGTLIHTLFAEVQRESNRRQAEGLPESMRWLESFQAAHQSTAGLGLVIPREATLTLEPGGERGEALVIAANLRAFPRLLRWLVEKLAKGDRQAERSEHRGFEILSFQPESHLAFAGGTLIFSSDRGALMSALDRLAGGAGTADPVPLLAALPASRTAAWAA